MMKKAKYDLEEEQKLTKFLDNQNRKLMARLDSLNKVKKNIPFPELKKYNHILENSLSFSIDHDWTWKFLFAIPLSTINKIE